MFTPTTMLSLLGGRLSSSLSHAASVAAASVCRALKSTRAFIDRAFDAILRVLSDDDGSSSDQQTPVSAAPMSITGMSTQQQQDPQPQPLAKPKQAPATPITVVALVLEHHVTQQLVVATQQRVLAATNTTTAAAAAWMTTLLAAFAEIDGLSDRCDRLRTTAASTAVVPYSADDQASIDRAAHALEATVDAAVEALVQRACAISQQMCLGSVLASMETDYDRDGLVGEWEERVVSAHLQMSDPARASCRHTQARFITDLCRVVQEVHAWEDTITSVDDRYEVATRVTGPLLEWCHQVQQHMLGLSKVGSAPIA